MKFLLNEEKTSNSLSETYLTYYTFIYLHFKTEKCRGNVIKRTKRTKNNNVPLFTYFSPRSIPEKFLLVLINIINIH